MKIQYLEIVMKDVAAVCAAYAAAHNVHFGAPDAGLGIAGRHELVHQWPAAIDAIRSESGYDDASWQDHFDALDATAGPTAYIFRCRHCGTFGGYSDCH